MLFDVPAALARGEQRYHAVASSARALERAGRGAEARANEFMGALLAPPVPLHTRLLGISPGYWSRIERNLDKPPSDEIVQRASAILGIRLDDLFVEAERLPPDMRKDMGRVVLAYRRLRSIRAS